MKKSVIGLGFGDEGKGLVTDYLCSTVENPLVVRFSGGHQIGHKVVRNNKRHVFSNFGSGTLQGVPTYWGANCTIDPVGLLKELKVLLDLGIKPKLYIDYDCSVVTPLDKVKNEHINIDYQHGTVGVGFGTTIEREENFYSLKAIDILNNFVFKNKWIMIKNYYDDDIEGFNRYLLSNEIKEFKNACKQLKDNKYIKIVNNDSFYNNDNIIYEGSQGLMLDPNIGFFPHVTRSTLFPKDFGKLNYYFVTRAYCTRHGNGPMPNEEYEELNKKIIKNPLETNTFNNFQGEFRRTILDVSLLEYALNRVYKFQEIDSHNNLVITCLDHVKDNYVFTYHSGLYKFKNKEEFCLTIGELLNIDNIFISEDDKSHIEKLRKY